MQMLRDRVAGIRGFFGEVTAEMRKSVWPEKQELIESTIVVIVSMLLLSAFVGISDKVLVTLLKRLTPAG